MNIYRLVDNAMNNDTSKIRCGKSISIILYIIIQNIIVKHLTKMEWSGGGVRHLTKMEWWLREISYQDEVEWWWCETFDQDGVVVA
jgi:hypothetical protein